VNIIKNIEVQRMGKLQKIEQEFISSLEPSDLLSFRFNPDNDNHKYLCLFIARKLKEWDLKVYTTSRKLRYTNIEYIDLNNNGGDSDGEKD
jgi:hypothetical protein